MKTIYGKMISFLMGILCGGVLMIPIGWIFGIEGATGKCFELLLTDVIVLIIVIIVGGLVKEIDI